MKKIHLLFLPLLSLTLTSCSVFDFIFGEDSSLKSDYSYDEPSLSSLDNTEQFTTLKYSMDDLSDHGMYNTPAIPDYGNVNILVIPVWFKDSGNHVAASKKDSIRQDIQKAYFGTDAETGWKSVRSYYQEASYGKVNMSGKVTDWYTADVRGSTITESGVDSLVEKSVAWYKTSNNDIKDFDQDGDGYIDCVCLIYAYPNSYNDSDTLWAYTYWLQDSNLCSKTNPGPNTYFWASYDFMYEDGGDISHCSIDAHTYIHEMGHAFGLDDYYDYAQSTSYNNVPAGGFSMQDYNVGDHDPLSKLMLGWSKAYAPTDSCTINIHKFEESGEIIILSPDFTGSPFDEYLILELYTPTGLNKFDSTYRWGGTSSSYPKGPSKTGIRVWHADARLSYITSKDQTQSASKVSNAIESGKSYCFANTNTTYRSDVSSYCSNIKEFRNYNLLQLLRNNTTASYAKGVGHTADTIKDSDLWLKGNTFTMAKYKSQFYNSGKLNSGSDLGFSFVISDITSEYASIKITKQ